MKTMDFVMFVFLLVWLACFGFMLIRARNHVRRCAGKNFLMETLREREEELRSIQELRTYLHVDRSKKRPKLFAFAKSERIAARKLAASEWLDEIVAKKAPRSVQDLPRAIEAIREEEWA